MTFIGTILKCTKVNQNFRRLSMIKELSCTRNKVKLRFMAKLKNLTVNHFSNFQINWLKSRKLFIELLSTKL